MLIDSIIKNSYNNINISIQKYKTITMQSIAKIDALSPLKTLSRGYSVVQGGKDGNVIKSINEVENNDSINIIVSDGNINAIVRK